MNTPEKITLTQVYISDKDKNGNPLTGKNGPYSKISVKSREYGDRWVGGFVNKLNANWKVGDNVDVIVTENGQYLNFRTLGRIDLLELRVEALEIKAGVRVATQPSAPANASGQQDDRPF